ncbi:MAG TPA: enoyl-CoA hydratase-related protein [Blastocatellia bacterium]|nr:enoyl-CoA hydratase-related protein [Blastocatellia bacterium]
MSQAYKHLLIATTPEGVRTITLNRPEKFNAVNPQLAAELPQAVSEASADEAVRVVVITGAGKGFCAGLDLTDPSTRRAFQEGLTLTRHERLDDLQWVGRWALALTGCDKPVIAAINGPAAGAGFGLTLAADIRLMSEAATLTAGYARIGLSPDAGVTWFLPRLVGVARATELILTARDIRADEAERIGLSSRVFAADSFAESVAAYAAQLAAGPPIALALTKRLLRATTETDLTTQLKMELALIQRGFGTADNLEAIRAFAEKRKPVFTGK